MSSPPFDTTAEPATIDRVYSALATETRRSVLAYFEMSATQTASLDDLVEYVAANQSSADARTRERVALRLHHVGLPKLADAGLIDCDPRTRTVRYYEQSDVVDWEVLDAESQHNGGIRGVFRSFH